jgi:prepilin-type processing-associated H-X9-DG protein
MKPKTTFTKKDVIIAAGCMVLLASSFAAIGIRGRESAKVIVCRANLKQFGYAGAAYLNDNDDSYPSPWLSLVATEYPSPGYERFCRWHDARYPPDGPLCLYIQNGKVLVCPTFRPLGKFYGRWHPNHDSSTSVEPQYSYTMNAYLGSGPDAIVTGGGVYKFSQITRSKAEVFFFAEENAWLRPGCNWVLNDTALLGDGRDWFGTFHKSQKADLNSGVINAVFVDGHVQQVRSALGKNPNDKSQMEFGRFEKYGWPHSWPFQ